MKRENFTVTDGLEYCDNSFLCLTGGLSPAGLEFGLDGGHDFDSEDHIGAIDAPPYIPAGGWHKVSDHPFSDGVFQKITRRHKDD
jgi:hypothetical protein